MIIQLNGEAHDIDTPATVADLLAQTGLAGRPVAVEVNREIVPRSLHARHALADGDRVEIVHAIGGG
jgi:sulfur carrier protein